MDEESTPNRSPMAPLKAILAVIAIGSAFALGYYFSEISNAPSEHDPHPKVSPAATPHDHSVTPQIKESAKHDVWTCSMHPQIKLNKPGKCPICFMDLIPLETDKAEGTSLGSVEYALSDRAKALAEVQTVDVKRARAKVLVRMVGMVAEDETRVAALTSRVDGRLDELYVNFTGVRVNKGDPMVTIWSPTLIRSQVELFETMRSDETDNDVVEGAKERLIQMGLTDGQIRDIIGKKKPNLYVTLRAPISGIVMKKNAVLGQFVKEGTEMFMINDLSHVWVKLDAYETDMPWIRYGQDLTFTTTAVPGRQFKGKVIFIDPVLNMTTRSVKIRVEAENPDFLLKPGMFVSAVLEAEVDHRGKVMKREWAGKYVCPIHPRDEASPEPGTCPDSKLALRPASAFGYAEDPDPKLPLVIPVTAPLITGKRAVVYVEVPDKEQPTYEGREVVLGPRAGKQYVVYKGLKEGERVVTEGNFKIDSAMQILARPSMMNMVEPTRAPVEKAAPQEELIERIEVSEEFLRHLVPVTEAYLGLKDALVEEKTHDASTQATLMSERAEQIDTEKLDRKAKDFWQTSLAAMKNNLKTIAQATDVKIQRGRFDPLSESFVRVLMAFRHVMPQPLVVFLCPMASNGQGAYWIEAGEERRNPYFGRTPYKGQNMLTCGELIEKIPPVSGKATASVAASVTPSPTSDPEQTPDPSAKTEGSDARPESPPSGSDFTHEGGM